MIKQALVLALACVLGSACTSETEYGDCVGLGSDDEKDPSLKYEVDVGNIVLSVIFFETVFVPAVVAITEFECSVGRKAGAK